jgi:prepilin-type processing-associated H-X9-DG protein
MFIIALLLGVAIPALSGVHHSARVTQCLSNLRQLQLAHAGYMMDNRGYFIDVGLSHGGVGNEEDAWINTLRDDYDNNLVLQSPLDDSPHWPIERGGEGEPVPGTSDVLRRTSYGMNNFLSRSYSPAAAFDRYLVTDRASFVPDHANTIVFLVMAFEGAYAGSDHVHVEGWWAGPSQPDHPPNAAAEQLQTNAAGGRATSWTARSNYAFLDGHVETLEFSRTFINPDLNRFDPSAAKNFLARITETTTSE